MGIRTGKQLLDSLRDGREGWIDGERVRDVTTDPRLRGGAETMALLYDMQHEPDLIDEMTFVSPATGDRVGLSYIEPRSIADLEARRRMVKRWMDATCGMFGRSPDFMNIHVTGFASAAAEFARAGEAYGRNIRSYYEHAREADVAIRLLVIGRQPPEHLVGRRLGTIYATAYAAPAYLETVDLEHDPAGARWIGWGGDDRYPGWVRTSPFPEIPARVRIDDGMIQLEAARQGMGLAQLPCFLGDPDPALVRVGPGPPQPNFDIWLLSHPDLRDTARLRVFRDRIAEAIRAKSDLLEGRVGR